MEKQLQARSPISQKWNRVISAAAIVGVAVISTGCGSNSTTASSMLNSIQVGTYEQNGELWAQMSAELNTSGMILASINVPVVDPHNPNKVYGSIGLTNVCSSTSLCTGGGTLSVAVNISQISGTQTLDSNLPNGTSIPLGAAAKAVTVGLPIGNTGAKLYVGFGNGVAILGVAMPFAALDGLGSYVPGVDIFQMFNMGGATGVVGLFTGSSSKSTGIGLFADLSSYLNNSSSSGSSAVKANLSRIASVDALTIAQVKAAPLVEVEPSSSKKQAVNNKLYELSQKHTQLRLK